MRRLFLLSILLIAACKPPPDDEIYAHAPASLYSKETVYSYGMISTGLLCDVSGKSDICTLNVENLFFANKRPCTKDGDGEPQATDDISDKPTINNSGHVVRALIKQKACPRGTGRENYVEGIFAQETKDIEDALQSMGELGIVWRLPKTAILMEIDDYDMRNSLALAALESDEWRRSYGNLHLTNSVEERHNRRQFKDMNALVGKLLLSTGALKPLETLLTEGDLKISKLDVGQVRTEKFSSLHIAAPAVDDGYDVYVPVHAHFSITLERIEKN